MKRVKMALALLASALLLFSCYWTPQTGSGEFSIKFAGAPKGVGDSYARVYLLTEGSVLVPIGQDTDYAEAKISAGDTEVTVKGIPAGPRYKVLVSTGTQQAGWFEVAQYAESGLFEVSPGETQDVAVTLLDNPFYTPPASPTLMGKSLKGTIISGGQIYTVDAQKLYGGADVNSMAVLADVSTELSGYSINSVSKGIAAGTYSDVWVNSNRGILPYRSASPHFNNSFSFGEGVVPVLSSGAYLTYAFYQRDGGLGGSNGINPPASWMDVDLSDVVSGQPVRDMAIAGDGGYFLTKIGAFSISSTIDLDDIFVNGAFFTVGGSNNPILAIDYGNGVFTFGTGNGVWRDSDPGLPQDESQVIGTDGFSFHMIASRSDADQWAALSPYYLFIGSGSTVTDIFPFNAGLPGTVTGMIWNGGTLVISGTEGMVAY